VGIIEHDRHAYEARIPRKTKTQSTIELEPGRAFAGGERNEAIIWASGAGAGETLRAATVGAPPGRRGREVSSEGLDETIDRTRLRAPLGLPDGGRLGDGVIDEMLAGTRTGE
jgi:hypothetical protein